MTPVRAPKVQRAPTFESDLNDLHDEYLAIEEVLERLADSLRVGYNLPHIAVAPDDNPGVHGIHMDYPPHGADGKQAFFITYYIEDVESGSPMQAPPRVYTLLTISEQ